MSSDNSESDSKKEFESYITSQYDPSDSDWYCDNDSDSTLYYAALYSDNEHIPSLTDNDSANNNENLINKRKSRKQKSKYLSFLQISRSKSRSKSPSPNPLFSKYVINKNKNKQKNEKKISELQQTKEKKQLQEDFAFYKADAIEECSLYGLLQKNDTKFNMKNNKILSKLNDVKARSLKRKIAIVIGSHYNLTEINMDNCGMDDELLTMICRSLIKFKKHWKIETINISSNCITT